MSSSPPPRYPPSLPNPPSPPPLNPNTLTPPPPPFPIPFPAFVLPVPENPERPRLYLGYRRAAHIAETPMIDESYSSGGKWREEACVLTDVWRSNPDYKKFGMNDYVEWAKAAQEDPKWRSFMEAYLEWKTATGARWYAPPPNLSSSTSSSDENP